MNYTSYLIEVMTTTKGKAKILGPLLTFDVNGWSFNGIHYGKDEDEAIRARDIYYNKKPFGV